MSVPLSSAKVAALANASGFDLCGFARAEPIPAPTFMAWLHAGMAADMDWMAERAADRLDVHRRMRAAKTVIALACNFYHPDDGPCAVARYARGRDYHATLRDRLRALRRRLKELAPGIESRGGVDAEPFMEKVWAARAGLGYVGRSGCFITERFGSHVVLAVLVIDRAVDAYGDGPTHDRCGTCSLCTGACPTAAIVADGVVDSRRCLSYQTIENRGEVPEEVRHACAGTVFGCDICQDVCPLNRSPIVADARFAPRPLAQLSVQDFAALTSELHQTLIPGTALVRAHYDGLRRNAAYALGAAQEAPARAVLEGLARDESAPLSRAARWALGRLPS